MPAPSIAHLDIGDDPGPWRAAGFDVADSADGPTIEIGTVRLRLLGADAGGHIRSWALRDLPPETVAAGLDGIATSVVDDPPAAGGRHPNGTVAVDHLVLTTPDSNRTTAALEAVGVDARRIRDTDQYGAPMRQTFFRMGDVILELIGPPGAGTDGPCRFFGLALTVDDLDATARHLDGHLGRIKDAVQPGRRITTLRHKPLGLSVAIAFMSPDPDVASAHD